MNNLRNELSENEKRQLLQRLRAAVFFQVELWNTASSITEILNACQEGKWDTVHRLHQVRELFGDKIMAESDLDTFLSELEEVLPGGELFNAVLEPAAKTSLGQRLQKALWIQNQLWNTAVLIAEGLGETTENVIRRVVDLSTVADSGGELVESDLDFFLGIAPIGTVKQGSPLYV